MQELNTSKERRGLCRAIQGLKGGGGGGGLCRGALNKQCSDPNQLKALTILLFSNNCIHLFKSCQLERALPTSCPSPLPLAYLPPPSLPSLSSSLSPLPLAYLPLSPPSGLPTSSLSPPSLSPLPLAYLPPPSCFDYSQLSFLPLSPTLPIN